MENEHKVEETAFGTKTSHPSYGTLLFNRAYGGKHHCSEAVLSIAIPSRWSLDMLILQES